MVKTKASILSYEAWRYCCTTQSIHTSQPQCCGKAGSVTFSDILPNCLPRSGLRLWWRMSRVSRILGTRVTIPPMKKIWKNSCWMYTAGNFCVAMPRLETRIILGRRRQILLYRRCEVIQYDPMFPDTVRWFSMTRCFLTLKHTHDRLT